MMTDTVAATAARMACVIEGRFFLSQAQNFISESSSPPVRVGKITIDIRTVRLKRARAFDAFRSGKNAQHREKTFSF
jgi:hypothetical protein